ncbi:MAG: hypothetical protein HYW15_00810 [Candidatus Giovannonibacteria bacterium]|nr:MAG: hypothetical protein HYW15_00810 [Candidatus Giovannonibacteria bacterium]
MGKVDTILAESIKKFDSLFGVSIQKPRIKILKSRAEINKLWGKETDSWIVGWHKENTIYILDENKFEKESSHSKSDFNKTLIHELLHQYYKEIVGRDKPAWLNEGFCLYFAEQEKEEPSEEEKNRLDYYFDHWDKNGYKMAYFWVKRLRDKVGQKNFIAFLKKLKIERNLKDFKKHFSELFYKL